MLDFKVAYMGGLVGKGEGIRFRVAFKKRPCRISRQFYRWPCHFVNFRGLYPLSSSLLVSHKVASCNSAVSLPLGGSRVLLVLSTRW